MEKDLVYVKDIKAYDLEKLESGFYGKCFSDGLVKKVAKVKSVGEPFNVSTRYVFENKISVHYQKDRIFEDMKYPHQIGFYLRQANVECVWDLPKNMKPQELGLIHGTPTNIVSSTKIGGDSVGISRSIIPCQFYLIE